VCVCVLGLVVYCLCLYVSKVAVCSTIFALAHNGDAARALSGILAVLPRKPTAMDDEFAYDIPYNSPPVSTRSRQPLRRSSQSPSPLS
jgi:hypothetical protein